VVDYKTINENIKKYDINNNNKKFIINIPLIKKKYHKIMFIYFFKNF
jgi:hypothetical protein